MDVPRTTGIIYSPSIPLSPLEGTKYQHKLCGKLKAMTYFQSDANRILRSDQAGCDVDVAIEELIPATLAVTSRQTIHGRMIYMISMPVFGN